MVIIWLKTSSNYPTGSFIKIGHVLPTHLKNATLKPSNLCVKELNSNLLAQITFQSLFFLCTISQFFVHFLTLKRIAAFAYKRQRVHVAAVRMWPTVARTIKSSTGITTSSSANLKLRCQSKKLKTHVLNRKHLKSYKSKSSPRMTLSKKTCRHQSLTTRSPLIAPSTFSVSLSSLRNKLKTKTGTAHP